MRRSKLESYEAILGALVKRPLSIDHLAYKTKMDCVILNEYMAFLIANGVAERRDFGDKTVFAVTERGVTVFRTLDFQKYLKKLSKTLMIMDETIEDTSAPLGRRQKQSE